MIIDKLENIRFYEAMLPDLETGLAKIAELGESPELGRYEFDGGYLLVQSGETTPMEEGTFEAHRRYIDVQILRGGAEEMAWKPLSELTTEVPYDEIKDAERLNGTRENHMLISAGMFYAAFPSDGHKPGAHTDTPHKYDKIVMKLPVKQQT